MSTILYWAERRLHVPSLQRAAFVVNSRLTYSEQVNEIKRTNFIGSYIIY